MKLVGVVVLLIAVIVSVGYVVGPSSAATVEGADRALARTEHELRSAVEKNGTYAASLEERLGSDDRAVLPQNLREFLASTDRLSSLRDELCRDIEHLSAASAEKLQEFDRESSQITDPVTRSAMTGLRQSAREHAVARLAAARSAMDLLDRVLAEGRDVQHAAKCVLIADELELRGQQVADRVRQAKDEATSYAKLTTELLSRLTSTD